MKNIIFLSLIFLYQILISCLGICQKYNFDSLSPNPYYRNIAGGELIIYNQTEWYQSDPSQYPIKIIIIPSGNFFNGSNKYSPNAKYKIENNQVNITGTEFILDYSNNGNNFFKSWKF